MLIVTAVINDQYKSRVLLDTCSTNKFVTGNVVESLGLNGGQIAHKLCTLSRVDDDLSEIVDITLTSVVNDNHVTCTAYLIDTIPIT